MKSLALETERLLEAGTEYELVIRRSRVLSQQRRQQQLRALDEQVRGAYQRGLAIATHPATIVVVIVGLVVLGLWNW